MAEPRRPSGLHARLSSRMQWLLGLLPFVLVIGAYLLASGYRLADNPQDKILPSLVQMGQAIDRLAFSADAHSGEYVMLQDTLASLRRLGLGVLLAAFVGFMLGLNMGLLPRVRATLSGFVTFVSMIPPLAVLPVIFISFGVDELAKVMLIFIGVFPVITRDIFLTVEKLPQEQITKALTLGASQFAVIYRIVMPQILPRLIDTARLSLGAAWLFLIAAEAIASTDGLGYRIFLMRRYLAMDVILPYVLWITLLGFLMDWLLRRLVAWRFEWYLASK
ncbi:MAG: ABC transporter permease [Sulfuritalea sp.]|nr:ABC transporter permease [Sulfuritalea sp.]MDP1984884.1 ABC transporter permease [Sulfuritalea sp.]